MNQQDRNMIKHYLKKYFNVSIKIFTQEIFTNLNWSFFNKHNVTLEEMLDNYKLADKIEEEIRQPIPDIEYRQGKGYYANRHNPDIVLVIDEF